jgi:hypothetical protein
VDGRPVARRPHPRLIALRSVLASATLLISLLAGACAGAAPPRVVAFPVTGARPVDHIQGVFTDDVALATIARAFERDYGFAPPEVSVVFLATRQALEDQLLAAGYDPAFARDAAARMRAVALHRRVLINSQALSTSTWAARIGTLAHELVHCLQYDLAGGRRGTSEQWLREGFAEWIALDLLRRIDGVAAGAARRYLEDELASSRRAEAPRLDDMMTVRQWVELAGRPGIVPQVQAVLTVDLLIERHGIPAILDYFRRFAGREDPAGNFAAAFGQSREAFARDVDARLGLRRR